MDQDLIVGSAKAAPPAAFLTAHYLFGLTMPQLITLCTLIYSAGLAAQMLWKFYIWVKKKRYLDD